MVTRTEFMAQLASGGWLLFLSGCGGGGGGYNAAPTPPPPPSTCGESQFTDNHGHTLSIPKADLTLTTPQTYTTAGTASHTHGVTFSAAQLLQLKNGQSVLVTSLPSQGHTHDVTSVCT
jgi:hypothetical protein